MLLQHALDRGLGERGRAGEHLVENAGQAVEVGPPVNALHSDGLLGAHVGRRTEHDAGLAQLVAARRRHRPRDAEVAHHRLPGLEQDVLGLDIAMHDVAAVRVVQRARHLPGDLHGFLHGEPRVPPQPVAQRLALHVGHDVIEEARRLPGIVQREDVRVREPGGDGDLAQEARRPDAQGQVRMKNFQGDVTPVLQVSGEQHDGHPAAAQLALDAIALREAGTQAPDQLGDGNGIGAARPAQAIRDAVETAAGVVRPE